MSLIDDLIAEGRQALFINDFGTSKKYVERVVAVIIDDVPSVKKGLHRYKVRFSCGNGPAQPAYTATEALADVETVIGKLEWLKCKIERKADDMTQNVVNITNNNTANASSSALAGATLAEARKSIDALGDDVLSSDEKLLLKGLLADVEDADEQTLGDKVMSVVGFLGGKTFEVAKAVLPALTAHALGA